MIKKALVAAVAASLTGAAMAEMTAMNDSDLSAVTGQDGVAIVANLSVHISGITYTDNDGAGGSFTFGNVTATGLIAATIDILDSGNAELTTNFPSFPANINNALNAMGVPVGSDVVKIAIPVLGIPNGNALLLDVGIGDMTMGGGASFGSLSVTDVNPQGTTVYIAAKN